MGTREVYYYEQQKWVPYVSDPDKWYQHLLDIRDGLVEPDYIGRYIVGSGEKHRCLKEMEAKQIEKQRPVVSLVSPLAQATEMARSEINENVRRKKDVRRPRYHHVNATDLTLEIKNSKDERLSPSSTKSVY